jgi:uncharacterized membrane protein HdeD (DUF308 family)
LEETVSQTTGRGSPNRTVSWGVLSFGVVACIVGIVFITTNHDHRAIASFIVGVLALGGGWFMVTRKPAAL